MYAIEVQRVAGVSELRVVLDGVAQVHGVLPLTDDGAAHSVVVQLGS